MWITLEPTTNIPLHFFFPPSKHSEVKREWDNDLQEHINIRFH